MTNRVVERLFFALISFVLVIYVPWWVTAVLILIGHVLFTFYFEGVVITLFYDSLYAAADSGIMYLPDTAYLFTIMSIIVLIGAEYLRGRLLRGHVS